MALFNRTYLPLLILKLLQEEEMWGYRLAQVIRERTQGDFQFKEGALYPVLHELQKNGYVEAEWRPSPEGPARKYYRLTRRGSRLVDTERKKLGALARLLWGDR